MSQTSPFAQQPTSTPPTRLKAFLPNGQNVYTEGEGFLFSGIKSDGTIEHGIIGEMNVQKVLDCTASALGYAILQVAEQHNLSYEQAKALLVQVADAGLKYVAQAKEK